MHAAQNKRILNDPAFTKFTIQNNALYYLKSTKYLPISFTDLFNTYFIYEDERRSSIPPMPCGNLVFRLSDHLNITSIYSIERYFMRINSIFIFDLSSPKFSIPFHRIIACRIYDNGIVIQVEAFTRHLLNMLW